MSTILDLPETFKLNSDDYVLVEYNNTAYRIPVSDLMYGSIKANGFGLSTAQRSPLWKKEMHANSGEINYRRRTFRGKYLGTSMTASQFSGLKNGTPDLYLGDYWIIRNNVWRIADFDYLMGHNINTNGDRLAAHSVQIVNDVGYNSLPTTYFGSPFHSQVTSYYANNWPIYNSSTGVAYKEISSWMPSGLSLHPYVENYVTPDQYGASSTNTAAVAYIDWLTEYQVFGRGFLTPSTTSSASTALRIDHRDTFKEQLMLFKIAPEFIWPSWDSASPYGYPLRTCSYYDAGKPYYAYVSVFPDGHVSTSNYSTSLKNRLLFSVYSTTL